MELSFYFYVILALLVLNVASFLLFGYDKIKAKRNQWRAPERSLLLCSLLGPFGAYFGMRFFHHKTRKLKFVLIPIFVVLQLAVLTCAIIYLT